VRCHVQLREFAFAPDGFERVGLKFSRVMAIATSVSRPIAVARFGREDKRIFE